MKERVILLRFGELHLKGKNKFYFEKILKRNINNAMLGFNYKLNTTSGRYFVEDYDVDQEDYIVEKLTKVFGLVSLSIAIKIKTDMENLENTISKISLPNNSTFRVSVVRADKTFPYKSIDLEKHFGGIILKNNAVCVNLKNYQNEVFVDIRQNGFSYIFDKKIDCHGGMPVGTAGKSLLLLSGGIDSPVAGYMMAKRGMNISALHFHSYPYTSELAKNKVITLANELTQYCGKIKLFVVSFTEIQEEIHKNCKPEYMITIMRRIMMVVAQRICKRYKIPSITTGENLGQVASQTIEGMISTGEVLPSTLPIFRPLIAFDKIEIMRLAEKIGSYQTSILPYEDCCTVFLPKNPLIKPKLDLVHIEEEKLNVNALIDNALAKMEIIECCQ